MVQISAIDKIRKFLKLESDRGFDNKAVLGGLNRVIPSWEAEARSQRIDINLIQEVVSRLNNYHLLDIQARQEIIRYLLDLFIEYQPESAETPPVLEQNDDRVPHRPANVDRIKKQTEVSSGPRQTDSFKGSHRPVNNQKQSTPGLDAPLTVISGIGPGFAQKLTNLELNTLGDLLYNFPRRYDDYSRLKPINRLEYGEEITVIGTVQSIQKRAIKGGTMQVVEAVLTDGTGFLRLSWFNQPWIIEQLKEKAHVVVSGKIDLYLGRLYMNSPEWEYLDKEQLHTNRIVPVYRLTAHITQRWLRRIMHQTVHFWAPRMPDFLSSKTKESASLVNLSNALEQIHFPESDKSLKDAQYRLAFDEIFLLQLGVLGQKRTWDSVTTQPISIPDDWQQQFESLMPFVLTNAQKQAIQDIQGDLKSEHPMNRLLQGDVGSGKTAVAAAAIAMVISQGSQAALMAPTSILAEQHYQNIKNLFAQANPFTSADSIRLLVGNTSENDRNEILTGLKEGNISLLIGTHALIEDPVIFKDLRLTIIDEQHRFGVAQRSALRNKGQNPHLLVMTATPIPRSLALTVYGDLELSLMDEMPAGRQPVETHVVSPVSRERAYELVRTQVKNGRQAFIIYPLIEKGEREETKAAVDEHKKIQNDIFPDLQIGLLHGRMKADDKDQVMEKFKDGSYQILVSTSVVEVGVDVPNATVMMIEGANRFGLAQLHQFRGRVGRGSEKSFCLLIPETENSLENERLSAMVETNDGFILAEKDLQQRGPGDFLGTRQSGYGELKMANLMDVRLIEKARLEARKVFDEDPDFSQPENSALKLMVDRFWSFGKGDIS